MKYMKYMKINFSFKKVNFKMNNVYKIGAVALVVGLMVYRKDYIVNQSQRLLNLYKKNKNAIPSNIKNMQNEFPPGLNDK